MTKQVAIILSGCGVFDGSEIHETVLTFLALEKCELSYQTFASNHNQFHVVDHAKGEVSFDETRNMLVEANRLSRGNTKPLSALNQDDFDALVFVGGFGAAKNLSDFAINGKNYQVDSEIKDCIQAFNSNDKWILAMCISPVLIAKSLDAVCVTIGTDQDTIEIIEQATKSTHKACQAKEHHIDVNNKIISTPAYMLAENLVELEKGISDAIKTLANKISA